jgi:ABC-2 type transport system ATP-binding protein
MRQKLALIAAMQHDPSLLILDEPTDGLDPLIQRNFEEILLGLRDQGRTVFMSSHDLAEVERTCELVAVVRSGVIVAEERIADLQQRHASRVTVQFHEFVPDDLEQIPGVSIEARNGLRLDLLLVGDPNPLVQYLALHPVADLTISRASLEDIFMAYYEPAKRGMVNVLV